MRMNPELVVKALEGNSTDTQCLHAATLVPIPTPDGFMFAMRVVSHGDPGPAYKDDSEVQESAVRVMDYGMNESDLIQLAEEVYAAMAFLTGLRCSEN